MFGQMMIAKNLFDGNNSSSDSSDSSRERKKKKKKKGKKRGSSSSSSSGKNRHPPYLDPYGNPYMPYPQPGHLMPPMQPYGQGMLDPNMSQS